MKILSFAAITLLLMLLNCTYNGIEKFPDCSASGLTIEVGSKTDARCGQSNATISVIASGGSGNYSFSVNGGVLQQDGIFQNLAAGSYTISVKDNRCMASVVTEIVNQNGFNIVLSSTNADCNSSNGSLSITPMGGSAPFTFSFNAGGFTSATVFDHLQPGTYTVTGMDATSCRVSKSIKVVSKVSFANDISSIISTSCALSGCHKGTQGLPDFTSFKNIQSNASAIKSETSSRSMPIGKTLTDNQINLIKCWVNDGALDN